MRKAIVGLVSWLLCLSIGGVAQANVIFDVSGQFATPGATFAGTFAVDTAGNVVANSIDIDVLGVPGAPLNFYNLFEASDANNAVTLQLTNGVGPELGFTLMFTGSLGGFMGGPVTGGFVASVPGGFFQLTCAIGCVALGATGNVTVPEPATLVLLGLGLSGLVAARRRKLR